MLRNQNINSPMHRNDNHRVYYNEYKEKTSIVQTIIDEFLQKLQFSMFFMF